MSKRPINSKRANRLRKELDRTTPASFVDLFQWLKARKHVKTRDEAVHLILAGCLQVDGKPVGIAVGDEGAPYALGFLDSKLAPKLQVAAAGNKDMDSELMDQLAAPTS